MLLNRTLEPPIEIPNRIEVLQPVKFLLDNGMPCHYVHSPNQDVLRIEFIFDAGTIDEPGRLIAAATNDLSDEGTGRKTSKEIAEHFDFYGASFQTESGHDRASFTLFTLGKFLKEILPVVEEIINDPVFPEEELKTYKIQHNQRLSVSNKKVEFVARKIFAESIFGPTHPYGYYATEADFDNLTTAKLKDFHNSVYLNRNCLIIASGNVTDQVKNELNTVFGKKKIDFIEKSAISHATIHQNPSSGVYSEKKDAIQSAIRIGRKMFNKTHPDFIGMSILNTILGGYFGSRLMSNIREDKGYTYGIGSALVSLQQEGYFFIATEVGSQVTNETIKEIYSELARLQDETIGNEELKTVKNYLSGSFLRSIDGPFALADKWKGIHFYGLDASYHELYFEKLKNITAAELQEIAIKYLNKKDLIEVIIGKK